MLNSLLPKQAGNSDYHQSKIALWLFGLVVLLRTIISLNSTFNARKVATSADGIPIDSFSPDAAQTAVALFSNLGLTNLVICLICIVVLVRYRALVPLMFALLLVQYVMRQVLHRVVPIPRTGNPPASIITWTLLTLMVVGFVLSLWPRRGATSSP